MSPGSLRIAASRRRLVWNGRQRPLLGLALARANEIDFARSPSHWSQTWQRQLETVASLGLGAVALPRWFPAADAALEKALRRARSLGLVTVLETEAAQFDDSAVRALAQFARQHPGSFVLVELPPPAARAPARASSEALETRFETVVLPRLAQHGVSVAFASTDALGPGLGTLRRFAAHALFADGLVLPAEPELAPLSLLAACLAVRPEPRPALVRLRANDADWLRRVFATAMSTGHALVLAELPWTEDWPADALTAELRRCQALLDAMPADLPEARDAPLRVWTRSRLLADPRHIDPVLAALALLHRCGLSCDLAVDDFRDGKDEFGALWVPMHGTLDAESWASLMRHCWRGATVVVTGFASDRLAEERVRFLLEPEPRTTARRIAQQSWFELVHGSGVFVFSRERPELEPQAAESRAFVDRVVRLAELRPLSPTGALERHVRFGRSGALRADLETGALHYE